MQIKNFEELVEKYLTKEEIAEVKVQAHREVAMYDSMQKAIQQGVEEYMTKNKVGFNEVVRRLHASPAHVAKIRRGEANLTMSSMIRLFSTLNIDPATVFGGKK